MTKVIHHSNLYPRYIVAKVFELDSKELKRIGITHLAFDLDNTLVPRGAISANSEHIRFLNSLRRAGFTLLIASNRRRNIDEIAHSLQATPIHISIFAFKPLKAYYRKLIMIAGTSPRNIAMIGDHLLNDVVGGNRAGLITILVTSSHRQMSFFKDLYVRSALKSNSR